MKVVHGKFTGTGASLSISGLGFSPDLVIIRVDSASANTRTSFRTPSMTGDFTLSLVGATGSFTGGITSIDADGFTVGTSTMTNESGKTIYWTAYKKDGYNDFDFGAYVGNGSGPRTIAVSGFDPAMVFVKQNGSGRGRWKTTSVAGAAALALENINNTSVGTQTITALSTAGANNFTVGTDNGVNQNLQVYYWFAFKSASAYLAVGSYTGNGTTKSITGLAFKPIAVWIKGDTTVNAGHIMPDNPSNNSWHDFGNALAVTGFITSLNSDGFSLGNDAAGNTNAITYYYIMWGAITSNSQTQLGKSRITVSTTRTQTGKARIQVTTLQTQLGKSRIQKNVNQTILGLSRITATTSQTILGKSRITILTTRTQLGKSRITVTSSQTQTGKSRIQIISTQTTQGKSRITTVVSQTIQGISRITTVVNKTQAGKARITATALQNQLGKSDIRKTTTKTQLGKSDIQNVTEQAQPGKSRITATIIRTIAGIADIRNTTQQNILGVSKIIYPTYRHSDVIQPYSGNDPQFYGQNFINDVNFR